MTFLLLISFISIWILAGNNEREPNWRLALIQAAVIWTGYLVLGTELLNLFGAISRLSLAIMWTLPILAGILWIWAWLKAGKILRLPIIYHYDNWLGTVFDLFIILILIVTAVVAFVSPPNSQGALISGMSRVAHWEQNQSLAHYATIIESQNSDSPGAHIIFLNVYILGAHDRLVNLIVWAAFAGLVASAASLAEVFGAKLDGQRMAAIFTVTLPIAIAQSTGALNDLVLSFWVVSTVLMLLFYVKKSPRTINLIVAGLSAALAVLTKPSAYIFLWPFALWMVVVLWKRLRMLKAGIWAIYALVILLIINAGFFQRNHNTYGYFYHPADLEVQINEVRDWRVVLSNMGRNVALHADFPYLGGGQRAANALNNLHDWIDLDISDPRTTLAETFFVPGANTSEMTSGNPLHVVIASIAILFVVGLVVNRKLPLDVLVYYLALFFSFIMFCYYIKWQPAGSRLQLAYFVLFAPMLGLMVDRIGKTYLDVIVAVVMIAFAMPWLFQTQERPVFPVREKTYPYSVFQADYDALYFATTPDDHETYREISDLIRNRGIEEIGLHLMPRRAEYPFWALLGAPRDNIELRWLVASDASAPYLIEDFSPAVIICEDCPPDKIIRYTEIYEYHEIGIFEALVKEP